MDNLMSPTVFREEGYRLFFFSREERRKHIHISSANGEAKFWLEPKVELSRSYRYSPKELNVIQSIVEDNRDELVSAWRQYFFS